MPIVSKTKSALLKKKGVVAKKAAAAPTRKKNVSLSQQILDVINPEPVQKDVDPEDLTFDGARLNNIDSDSEQDDEIEEQRPVSKLRDPSLKTGKYAGKRTSRQQWESFDAEEEPGSDGDDDDENDGLKEPIDDGDEEIDSDEVDGFDDANGNYEEGDSDEEEEQNGDESSEAESDEAESRLQKELMEMKDQEKEAVKNIAEYNNEEMNKARHTRSQKLIWDSFLDCRIRMQPLLTIANKLPHADIFPLFIHENEDVKSNLETATHSLCTLVERFVDLKQELIRANDAFPEKVRERATPSRKRYQPDEPVDYDYYWQLIKDADDNLEEYKNETIDKWNQKTQLASGATAKKLKTINQSALKQIEQALTDRPRLLKRAHTNRAGVRALGTAPKEQPAENAEPTDEIDEEIYDDTDFYQQLLKDLIETNVNDMDPVALSRHWLEVRKLRPKKKKNVDRRASKGRKLRYNVHEQLVNFVAPVPKEVPPIVGELFHHLFGFKSETAAGSSTMLPTVASVE